MTTGDQGTHLRKAGTKARFKTSEIGDLALGFGAIDERFDSRMATPEIGAT